MKAIPFLLLIVLLFPGPSGAKVPEILDAAVKAFAKVIDEGFTSANRADLEKALNNSSEPYIYRPLSKLDEGYRILQPAYRLNDEMLEIRLLDVSDATLRGRAAEKHLSIRLYKVIPAEDIARVSRNPQERAAFEGFLVRRLHYKSADAILDMMPPRGGPRAEEFRKIFMNALGKSRRTTVEVADDSGEFLEVLAGIELDVPLSMLRTGDLTVIVETFTPIVGRYRVNGIRL